MTRREREILLVVMQNAARLYWLIGSKVTKGQEFETIRDTMERANRCCADWIEVMERQPKGTAMPNEFVDPYLLAQCQQIISHEADQPRATLIVKDGLGTIAAYAKFQKQEIQDSGINDDISRIKVKLFQQISKSYSETAGAL